MTENKQYTIKCDEINSYSIWKDNKDLIVFDLLRVDAEDICNELNDLYEEKEFWKSMCCSQGEKNHKLKRQFLKILKSLGKKTKVIQCSTCKYRKYYTEEEDGYYNHHSECDKKYMLARDELCPFWEINVGD